MVARPARLPGASTVWNGLASWREFSKWTEFAKGKLKETAGRSPVTKCDACGGPMKIIAALTEPDIIRKYLDHVGLPSRAPPISPAHQRPLEFDEAA